MAGGRAGTATFHTTWPHSPRGTACPLAIHMEVDESHLEPGTPSPVEDRHDSTFILNPTPDRPARLSSSLSNRQRLSLLDIDGGICFITGDRLPTISIQDAHIVQRRLSKEIVCVLMCLAKFH